MVTTQNAFWGGVRYDRNLDRKNFLFGSYDFERDRPKKLNFRSVAGGGYGMHLVKSENTEMDTLFGVAWNRTWQAGDNTDTPEALAGATLKHRFHEKLRVQNSFSFFQNITDKAEFRFIFDSTLTVDVTKRIGVFITVGDRFNNDPFGTAKNNDFLFTTGLKWSFGKKQ
jgi:putative salt-induced outer membrane protein YdiY